MQDNFTLGVKCEVLGTQNKKGLFKTFFVPPLIKQTLFSTHQRI